MQLLAAVVRCLLLVWGTFLHAALSSSGYVMFGSATRGDVLKNINLQYVRSLVGRHWAHALVTVRVD